MKAARLTALASLFLAFLLPGCSHYASSVPDSLVETPGEYVEAGPAGLVPAEVGRWWERFEDERLNSLMEEAFTNNLDLAGAYERLNQAHAASRATGSAEGIELGVGAQAGRARQGGVSDEAYTLSAAANYEIDLWRRLSSRTEAARLETLATREDLKAIYIGLSAELADQYYLAVEQRAQLELTDRTIETFHDTLERVELRYREGLVPALDVYQSRQNLALARARRPVFEAGVAGAEHAVSVLLGRFPGRDVTGGERALPDPPDFPAGLPSELLARRPDVEAAMLRVHAGDRRVAAAVADRFPSFNLVGDYGGASSRLSELLDSPNIFWNVLVEAAQPVLDGGRRRAEQERTEAAFRESIAAYRSAVLTSFREVEDALSRGRATKERIGMLEERVEASESSLRLALERYLQGLSDYLPVLTEQQRLFDAQSELIAARRQLISERIGLARALGGLWAEPLVAERVAAGNNNEGK